MDGGSVDGGDERVFAGEIHKQLDNVQRISKRCKIAETHFRHVQLFSISEALK
jgi:hypothetical protein